jgi:glyceraldehyde 3-phosphate dehydrogenase
MKIAINGMGRIGRLLCKLLASTTHEIVAVNDVMPKNNLVYLLTFDSIYGQYFLGKNKITETDEGFLLNGRNIKIFSESVPSQLPWKDLGIDLVIDCSGKFLTEQLLNLHLEAGAKKVLLSTTGEGLMPLIIRGFNDGVLKKELKIISSGGCMTNCTVLVLDHLIKKFGADSVHINVIHSYTSRQSLVDAPYSDFRRGRAATTSIIPVKTDLEQTLEKLFPSLQNNVATTSTRVPIQCGALVDLHITLKKSTSTTAINDLYHQLSQQQLKGLLGYNSDPITSSDIICNPNSAVVDSTLTHLLGNHLKLSVWFDDQFGFTNRLVELVDLLEH